MKQEVPPHPPALSLQGKLDRIAHERDVLALLRMLAAHGLREGDRVRHRHQPLTGKLAVNRAEEPPQAVIIAADGTQHPFRADHWRAD